MILHSNDQVAQWSKQRPVTSEIVGSIPTSDSTVVGSLRVLRFGNVRRVVVIVNCKLSVINWTRVISYVRLLG